MKYSKFESQVFLKILQSLQENTCARVSFLVKWLWQRCFPEYERIQTRKTPFLDTSGCKWNYFLKNVYFIEL